MFKVFSYIVLSAEESNTTSGPPVVKLTKRNGRIRRHRQEWSILTTDFHVTLFLCVIWGVVRKGGPWRWSVDRSVSSQWTRSVVGEDKTWTPSLDRVHGPPSWTRSMDPLHGPGPWTPFFLLFFCFISSFCFLLFVFFIFLTEKKRKLEEKRNKIKAHKAKSHGPLTFFIFFFRANTLRT